MTWLMNLRALSDSVDPRLWFVAVAIVVGAVVFAWRRVAPASWDKLPSRFKVLPAAVIGALLTAGAGAKASSVILDVILGGFSGLTAAGGHEMLVRLVSGKGDDRKKATPKKASKKKVSTKAEADAPEPEKGAEK